MLASLTRKLAQLAQLDYTYMGLSVSRRVPLELSSRHLGRPVLAAILIASLACHRTRGTVLNAVVGSYFIIMCAISLVQVDTSLMTRVSNV